MPQKYILIVDDARDIHLMASRTLAPLGYAVTLASTGQEALEAAHRTLFDVALVDYQMPPPDGLDVLRRLRALQPHCVRILMSGVLDLDVTLQAVNDGETARILQKPFDRQALVTAIDEAFDMQRRIGIQYDVQRTQESLEERAHLHVCLGEGVLRLALQPIVTMQQHAVWAFEALLRSQHPVLNGPAAVLGAAERHGFLAPLGALVAQRAAEWMPYLPPETRLFVNIHPTELADPTGFVQRLTPLHPWAGRIVLEITERSNMADVTAWETSIALVDQLGFALAVDDLGAGYNSLSMLAELKPQFIKIDMSIIRGCDQDRRKQRLVELLCNFGEATAAQVLAEGVETAAEAAAIQATGVHLMQGYFFGRPQLALSGAGPYQVDH